MPRTEVAITATSSPIILDSWSNRRISMKFLSSGKQLKSTQELNAISTYQHSACTPKINAISLYKQTAACTHPHSQICHATSVPDPSPCGHSLKPWCMIYHSLYRVSYTLHVWTGSERATVPPECVKPEEGRGRVILSLNSSKATLSGRLPCSHLHIGSVETAVGIFTAQMPCCTTPGQQVGLLSTVSLLLFPDAIE